jgi:predicted glycoside hydrolase/deacetylase ChbG (UPF0249 family)
VKAAPPRKIILCADDYGLTRPINGAIRELIMAGRLNAASVMALAPAFDRAEAEALLRLNTNRPRAQIGLHVTLTGPFTPLTAFAPTRDGRFLPLPETLRAAMARRLRPDTIEAEIGAQLRAFVSAFGRPPDFLDGHQHVQLFPQIRDAFLKVAERDAPGAWVRQCGRATPLPGRLRDAKALLLDVLSVGFRRKARWLGVDTNPAFAGTYDFDSDADFARLFPTFLDRLPDGGVVMCHPGIVDAELQRLDPLTTLRERERDYLISDEFPRLLAANGVTLG